MKIIERGSTSGMRERTLANYPPCARKWHAHKACVLRYTYFTHAHAHAHTRTCTHTHTHTHTHTYTHTYTHTRTLSNTHSRMYTCTPSGTYKRCYTCTYIRMHVCTHTRACVQAQTFSHASTFPCLFILLLIFSHLHHLSCLHSKQERQITLMASQFACLRSLSRTGFGLWGGAQFIQPFPSLPEGSTYFPRSQTPTVT